MLIRLIVVILCCLPVWTLAETFKVLDEDGNVTYTDSPKQNERAEVVDLPPVNTVPKTDIDPIKSEQERPSVQVPDHYDVSITSPEPNTQILAHQRNLSVSFTTTPPLHTSHFARLFISGKPYGGPIQSMSFVIEEIYRGEHSLQVIIVDQSGQPISQSQSVSVIVFRPRVKR